MVNADHAEGNKGLHRDTTSFHLCWNTAKEHVGRAAVGRTSPSSKTTREISKRQFYGHPQKGPLRRLSEKTGSKKEVIPPPGKVKTIVCPEVCWRRRRRLEESDLRGNVKVNIIESNVS